MKPTRRIPGLHRQTVARRPLPRSKNGAQFIETFTDTDNQLVVDHGSDKCPDGATWSELWSNNNLAIASNKVKNTADNTLAGVIINTGLTEGTFKLTFTKGVCTGARQFGVLLRTKDANNYIKVGWHGTNQSGNVVLIQCVGGSEETIDSGALTLGSAVYTITVTVADASVYAEISDGAYSKRSVEGAVTNITRDIHGLYLLEASASTPSALDNFLIYPRQVQWLALDRFLDTDRYLSEHLPDHKPDAAEGYSYYNFDFLLNNNQVVAEWADEYHDAFLQFLDPDILESRLEFITAEEPGIYINLVARYTDGANYIRIFLDATGGALSIVDYVDGNPNELTYTTFTPLSPGEHCVLKMMIVNLAISAILYRDASIHSINTNLPVGSTNRTATRHGFMMAIEGYTAGDHTAFTRWSLQ